MLMQPNWIQIPKTTLELLSVKDMSRADWLLRRQDGLGGSDMGTILSLNHRQSRLQLFYQKIGLDFTQKDLHNKATAMGQVLEDDVLFVGQYLDFDATDDQDWVRHYEVDDKLRKIEEFKYMARNSNYPWLLANIDGAVNPAYTRFDNGTFTVLMDAVGEGKTISRQAAEMWIDNFPPYYVPQGIMYTKVLEPILKAPVFQIFFLKDASDLYGFEIDITNYQSLVDRMMQESYEFHLMIEHGKEIIANSSNEDEMMQALGEIEPEPDSSPAYEDYLSELYLKKKNYVRIIGSDEVLEWAELHQEAAAEIKRLQEKKQMARNIIKKIMKDMSANVIDFGDRGRITYNKKLYFNIK